MDQYSGLSERNCTDHVSLLGAGAFAFHVRAGTPGRYGGGKCRLGRSRQFTRNTPCVAVCCNRLAPRTDNYEVVSSASVADGFGSFCRCRDYSGLKERQIKLFLQGDHMTKKLCLAMLVLLASSAMAAAQAQPAQQSAQDFTIA